MRLRIFISVILFYFCLSSSIFANWLEDIWRSELRMEGLQGGILDKQGQILSVQRDILSSQKDIQQLSKNIEAHLSGHSGWGDYQFRDYQSYGNGAYDWNSVLQMAEYGQGEGALGKSIGGISKQFPMDNHLYNKGIQDTTSQTYYSLKAKTLLATRAASQLDYDKIQEQIAYQQMLRQQIEKTHDLKAAVDLSSRIQIEGNLIQLAILRQAALNNQQQSITEQANVNLALSHAKFLTRRN